MREIKFRAWNEADHRYYYFINGRYFNATGITAYRWRFQWEHVEQFTGLLDKNGKKIYEGDITQTVCGDGARLSKFVIEWDEANCRFVKHRHDGEIYDLDSIGVALHEIIGNVHENPELWRPHNDTT